MSPENEEFQNSLSSSFNSCFNLHLCLLWMFVKPILGTLWFCRMMCLQEVLCSKWNMERSPFSLPFSTTSWFHLLIWRLSVYPVFVFLPYSVFFLANLSNFRTQTQILLDSNSKIPCLLLQSYGLLLMDGKRFLGRAPDSPPGSRPAAGWCPAHMSLVTRSAWEC